MDDDAVGDELLGSVELGALESIGLRVVEVDGGAVRSLLDIEFALAGNPGRYPFIDADQIWVDRCLGVADAAATVVHEVVEYELMLEGMGYEQAHAKATEAEQRFRFSLLAMGTDDEDPVALADGWLVTEMA